MNDYWSLTNSGIEFTTYSVTFNFDASDVDPLANTAAFIVGKYSGGWTYPTVGTRTATSTQATGLTAFSDFALGETLTALNDFYTTPQNTTLVVAAPGVLSNDSGTGLTAVKVTDPPHGTVTLNLTGSFTYIPDTGYQGPDHFTYHTLDGGTSNDATVVISVVGASNPAPVQTFYVPFPEDQLLTGLQTIAGNTTPASPVSTYISIAVLGDDTLMYYDQWENGYDANIANPVNLYSSSNPGGTQIWGDGNPANGYPPGVPTDILRAGTVIILKNDVVIPRIPSNIYFDGGDKIAATRNIVVTRTSWAAGSSTLLAGCVEVYDTSRWGTNYRSPIGVDIPDNVDYQMFEYSAFFIMAGPLGATISVDANADGDYADTGDVNALHLNQGVGYVVTGLNVGAHITSDNPIQVDTLSGDIGSNYESRDSALLPTTLWSSSYYTPVSTPEISQLRNGTGTTVWLYNPGTSPISVTYTRRENGTLVSSNLTVPGSTYAGGYLKQIITETPVGSGTGAHFYTTGALFYAKSTTDSTDSTNTNDGTHSGNQAWDWGFTLIPDSFRTPMVIIGLGIGRDPTSPTNPDENGNPVWVTTVGNGDVAVPVYVDYDANPATGPFTDPDGRHYDVALSLRELEQAKVYDTFDRDQTGMLLYTLTPNVKLSVAWGQDPLTASPGAPGLDVGTAVPPAPMFYFRIIKTLLSGPYKNGTGWSVTDTVTISEGPDGDTVNFYSSTNGGTTWASLGATKTLSGGQAASDPYSPDSSPDSSFWTSYSQLTPTLVTQNDFQAPDHTVYMRGHGFTTGNYTVAYYDGSNSKVATDTVSAAGGVLTSQLTLTGYTAATPGTWHAVVYPISYSPPLAYVPVDIHAVHGTVYLRASYNESADINYSDKIAEPLSRDAAFIVEGSSLPEFPTVMAGICVAGACGGIYGWMRKRRTAHGAA